VKGHVVVQEAIDYICGCSPEFEISQNFPCSFARILGIAILSISVTQLVLTGVTTMQLSAVIDDSKHLT